MEHPTDSPFRLLVFGDGSVRTIPLHGQRWVIGRATECQVQLRDPTVSRRHLLLVQSGGTFQFQDLSGSNPVLLDGKPARGGALGPGQTLAIGLTRLVLDFRDRPPPPVTGTHPTVVLSREVVDDDANAAEEPDETGGAAALVTAASRVLDRIEWTFADLGDLHHAAEPLLDLALNLTGHRRGWIGRFTAHGSVEILASLDVSGRPRPAIISESVLHEARRISRPHLLATQEGPAATSRLVIPLGDGPDGLLLLEDPSERSPKGQGLLRLARSLRAVIWHRLQETTERQRLRDELQRLRFHGSATHNALLASTRLQDVRQALREFASTGEPVLLVGEEGTELEDLARYLHAESPRRLLPFVSWNAVRVPEGQHERDLFGDGQRSGAIHRARGGTLFLERFDWLSPTLQQRLADTLAAQSMTDPLAVVAAVAATDAGVAHATQAFPWSPAQRLLVPPLRGHVRDILTLAELFLSELGTRPDGTPRLLTERAKRLLVTHSWPGNVREMRLVLESAAAQAMGDPIAPRHLPTTVFTDASADSPTPVPTLEEVEKMHIQEIMLRTGGKRANAAKILGIANSTLYEKLRKFGIDG